MFYRHKTKIWLKNWLWKYQKMKKNNVKIMMMIVMKLPFIVEKNTCTLWKWLKGDIKYYNKNVCKRHVSLAMTLITALMWTIMTIFTVLNFQFFKVLLSLYNVVDLICTCFLTLIFGTNFSQKWFADNI